MYRCKADCSFSFARKICQTGCPTSKSVLEIPMFHSNCNWMSYSDDNGYDGGACAIQNRKVLLISSSHGIPSALPPGRLQQLSPMLSLYCISSIFLRLCRPIPNCGGKRVEGSSLGEYRLDDRVHYRFGSDEAALLSLKHCKEITGLNHLAKHFSTSLNTGNSRQLFMTE